MYLRIKSKEQEMKEPTSLVILYIMCRLQMVVSKNVISIDPPASVQYFHAGEDITLTCNFAYDNGSKVEEIRWKAKGKQIFKHEEGKQVKEFNKGTLASKVEYTGPSSFNESPGSTKITVKNLENADFGQLAIECNVDIEDVGGSLHELSKSVHVMRNVTPSIPSVTSSPNTKNIKAGEDVTMTCKGNIGAPRGQLSWRRKVGRYWNAVRKMDDLKITATNEDGSANATRTYKYTFRQTDDKVLFRCEVRRHSQEKLEPSVELEFHVVSGANIKVTVLNAETNTVSQSFEEGQTIRLQCSVEEMRTKAIIEWFFGKKKLEASGIHSIENAKAEQSGIYTCVVTNVVNGDRYSTQRNVSVEIAASEGIGGGWIAVIVIGVIVIIGLVAGVLVFNKPAARPVKSGAGSQTTIEGTSSSIDLRLALGVSGTSINTDNSSVSDFGEVDSSGEEAEV